MILGAIDHEVSKERLARTFGVNLSSKTCWKAYAGHDHPVAGQAAHA
jgi:hypothetical protein